MAGNTKRIVKDPQNPTKYVVALDPTVTKKLVEFLKPWTSATGREWAAGEIAGYDKRDPAQMAELNSLLQSATVRYWTA